VPIVTRLCFIIAGALLLAIVGCGSGDLPLSEADPDAVSAEPTFDQVFSIFQRECAPCHTDSDGGEDEEDEEDQTGGTSPRQAAFGGVEPDYTTCASVIENLDDAIEQIFDKNEMPPGAWPRLTSEEKLVIERWVEQWEDGGRVSPCN
jgi:mono/diheme cytochrome c family protein